MRISGALVLQNDYMCCVRMPKDICVECELVALADAPHDFTLKEVGGPREDE